MLSSENAWKILMFRLGIPEIHWVMDVSSLMYLSNIYFLSKTRTSGIGKTIDIILKILQILPVAPIVWFRFIMFRLTRCMLWSICSIMSGRMAFNLWYIPMTKMKPAEQQPLHWCFAHQTRPQLLPTSSSPRGSTFNTTTATTWGPIGSGPTCSSPILATRTTTNYGMKYYLN